MPKTHDWWCWVPIPVDVIRNEDGVYAFKFRFDIAKEITGMDELIIAHFDPHTTGCRKCQQELENCFGKPCNEFT